MMTPKQRWLSTIRLEPVDRLVFWPKLSGSYPPPQKPPFNAMGLDALHEWIGSDPHTYVAGCVKEVRHKTSAETKVENGVACTVYKAPAGECRFVQRWDQASTSWHPVEFPAAGPREIEALIEYFTDATAELDEEGLAQGRAQAAAIGETALVANGAGTSALMDWVEHLAGAEGAHFLLMDHEPLVEALFQARHKLLRRTVELFAEYSPADVIYLTENTSTTLISPDQYRRWCLPHIREYAAIMRSAGRLLVLHMCGHLKAILPDLETIGAAAFEAFTSPSLGNTTLLDGRSACPEVCLIGGTNAILWTRPAGEIIAAVEADLDALPHHRGIALTSAGVMPPLAAPATIKAVADWVKAYPARM